MRGLHSRFCTQKVFSVFDCLNAGGHRIGGVCFKPTDSRRSWVEAYQQCQLKAPTGYSGRLAVVSTNHQFRWLQRWALDTNDHSWLGVKAVSKSSNSYVASDFEYYPTDPYTPGDTTATTPFPGAATLQLDQIATPGMACVAIHNGDGKIKDFNCLNDEDFICEFTSCPSCTIDPFCKLVLQSLC